MTRWGIREFEISEQQREHEARCNELRKKTQCKKEKADEFRWRHVLEDETGKSYLPPLKQTIGDIMIISKKKSSKR